MFYKIPFTGDVYNELTQIFIALAIVVVLTLAWWTTSIRENLHNRTIYFVHRRLRTIQRLTNHTVSSTLVESTHSSANSTRIDSEAVTETSNSSDNSEENKPPDSASRENPEAGECTSNSAQNEEQESIIQTMDAGTSADVARRRIEFFEGRRETTQETNSQMIMENNYADRDNLETNIDNNDVGVETDTSHSNLNDTQNNIRIKIKYINDDLRLVDGKLEELLGDFKRRNFQSELSANKLVKLIFKGKVLQSDQDTLQSYGIFDNCVVHCLIHQNRSNPNDTNSNGTSSRESPRRNGRNTARDWDLGNLLIVLISILLSSAWYFRYQYPQFFTITATVALVAMTGIFTIVSIGMYFPDPDPTRTQVR